MTHFRVQGSEFSVQGASFSSSEFFVFEFRVFLFLSLACFVSFVFEGWTHLQAYTYSRGICPLEFSLFLSLKTITISKILSVLWLKI